LADFMNPQSQAKLLYIEGEVENSEGRRLREHKREKEKPRGDQQCPSEECVMKETACVKKIALEGGHRAEQACRATIAPRHS